MQSKASALPEGCARLTDYRPMFAPPKKYRDRNRIAPHLRTVIRELAAGERRWPLLIYGEEGSGKSCAGLCVIDTYGGWYDSRRGGIVLFTDVGGNVRFGDQLGTTAITQEFPAYDDNDDHDVWPDNHFSAVDWMYVPVGPYHEPGRPGGRPESGVYPGLDMDGDLVLDYDKNRNAVEDWREPFLAFDADPPEFVYID